MYFVARESRVGAAREVIKTTKDGRTIRSGKDYTKFRYDLHTLQGGKCVDCKRYTSLNADLAADWSFHTDHIKGRGMGGSKRDDTFDACAGRCGKCHRKKHNQQ